MLRTTVSIAYLFFVYMKENRFSGSLFSEYEIERMFCQNEKQCFHQEKNIRNRNIVICYK